MLPWTEQVPQSTLPAIDWTVVSDIATLMSALTAAMALVCTLRYLRRQDRILGSQLEMSIETKRFELYQNVMKEMQEISRLFLSAPELRPYFYDGKPAPCNDGELPVRIEVMTEMLVDFMGSP